MLRTPQASNDWCNIVGMTLPVLLNKSTNSSYLCDFVATTAAPDPWRDDLIPIYDKFKATLMGLAIIFISNCITKLEILQKTANNIDGISKYEIPAYNKFVCSQVELLSLERNATLSSEILRTCSKLLLQTSVESSFIHCLYINRDSQIQFAMKYTVIVILFINRQYFLLFQRFWNI